MPEEDPKPAPGPPGEGGAVPRSLPEASAPRPAADPTTSIPDAERTPSSRGASRGAAPTFQPGDLLAGRYRIEQFIAEGGMGEVYKAEDTELGGPVALKTVKPEIATQAGAVERFKKEIQLSRIVTHDNVCRIFDLGRHVIAPEAPGLPGTEVLFLTMEYLPGETLSQRVRRLGKLRPEEALPIVRQMADGLDKAHTAGIIHRDFKSANVVLVPSSRGDRAVVADFGLAHVAVRDPGAASLTAAGKIVGTPAYMAPEQLERRELGPWTDIYALGVVMFEMVTGRWPFEAEDLWTTAVLRLKQPPPSPRSLVPELEARWEATILRCLERDRNDRFRTAQDVARALEGGEVVRGRRARRRRGWAAAAATALALAFGLLLYRGIGPSRGASGPAEAIRVRRSVAVLGFKNLGQPDSAWLSTAVSEMLRTELGAGGALRTIPGESVARATLEMSLADTDSLARDTLARIRENLGADLVVLGSYLSVGKERRVRLDLRLQDTATGEVLANVAETGTEDGIFDVVSGAGAALRASLGVGTVPEGEAEVVRGSLPEGAEARRFFAEGLARLRLFDVQTARHLLEKAVAADPGHAPSRSALAMAWSALGYDQKARVEAQRAFDLSESLPREYRLAIEGLLRETAGAWDEAIEIHRALFVFFPDSLDYGLRLAAAQTAAGRAADALGTLDTLRRLPSRASDDSRIDLAEAAAAKALTDFGRQLTAATRAALRAKESGSRLLLAEARLAAGTALVDLDRPEEARSALEEARGIFAGAGDRASVARTDNLLGVGLAKNGDLAGARGRFEAALQTSRQIGDQRGIAQQLSNLANVDVERGRHAQAKRLFEEALGVSREIGDRAGEALALTNLGATRWEMGDVLGAERAYEEALETYSQIGATRHVALLQFNLGEVLEAKGSADGALERYATAADLFRRAGAGSDAADALARLGRIRVAQSRLDAARTDLEEAVRLYREAGDRGGEAAALKELGGVLERTGDDSGARRLRQQAAALEKPPQ